MASARRLKPDQIAEIFRRFRATEPEPKGELQSVDPFTLLVAVVLSAQATDAGVNRATRALFAVADTPQKMLALGEEKLRDYIRTIGLYRTKAKNVIALSEKLIRDFGGEVPRTRPEIESLPGAGQDAARSRSPSRTGGARRVQAPRPSLAHPAWALRLQGAQARMLALPHQRYLPVQAEDARTCLKICTK